MSCASSLSNQMVTLLLLMVLSFVCAQENHNPALGIDLGNEWMKFAIVNPDGKMLFDMAVNEQSNRKTPALLGFSKYNERVIGETAQGLSLSLIIHRNPSKVFYDVKTLLGESFSSANVEQYKLVEDSTRHSVLFEDSKTGQQLSPEEIIAMLLSWGKQMSTDYADVEFIRATVLTAPVYFTQQQRELLQQAATLAGLEVLAVIDDLSAAAIDYGVTNLRIKPGEKLKAIIYNIGSHGVTASLVEYSLKKEGEKEIVEVSVIGRAFDESIGGLSFDVLLRNHLADTFDKTLKDGNSVRTSDKAMMKILAEARKVKELLTATPVVNVNIEQLYNDIDFTTKITREEFEKLTEGLYAGLTAPIEKLLQQHNLKQSDISTIELFGGMTRYPKVKSTLEAKFPSIPLGVHINGDEGAAFGAAHYAGVLSNINLKKGVTLTEPSPPSTGNVAPLTDDQMEQSRSKISEIVSKEWQTQNSIAARNVMETYLNDMKEIAESSPEELKNKLLEILAPQSAWLEQQTELLPASAYQQQISQFRPQVEELVSAIRAANPNSSTKDEL